MPTVAEGVSANTATLVVLVVWQFERKTGPCAAFDVKVAGQETKTTRGVSSNSGVSTRVRLPFGAGMGMVTEVGVEMNSLGVAGGLRVACSQG